MATYTFTTCLFLLSKQHSLSAVDFKNIFVVSPVTVPSIPNIPNQWRQTNGYNPLCAGFNNRIGLSNAPYNYYMRYNPLCDNQIVSQRTFSNVYPYRFREYSICSLAPTLSMYSTHKFAFGRDWTVYVSLRVNHPKLCYLYLHFRIIIMKRLKDK